MMNSAKRSAQPQPVDLDDLLSRMRADDPTLPDWGSLPTFGGDRIVNTDYGPVWSWDAKDVLWGTVASLEIISREDWLAHLLEAAR